MLTRPQSLDPFSYLSDLPMDQTGIHPLEADGVSVRAYPYPYIAALSISNDLDSMLAECFESWHAFVNGRGPTADGDGLGLEVGDSFWIWTYKGPELLSLHLHYAHEQPVQDSLRSGQIIELGRLGWLDTLHSMGNWPTEPGTLNAVDAHRDQAVYALDRLDSLGVKPSVYVNHSGSVSNVGGPWGDYQRADDPNHPFYCMDLLKAFGFKFFWPDACLNFEKFGDHLQYPTRHHFNRAIYKFPWPGWLRRSEEDGTVNYLDFGGDAENRHALASFFNRTLLRVKGRDGSPFLAFKRHRGFEQPIMSTFCDQVTDPDLDALEEMRGAVIVYQHFGRKGPRGRGVALSRKQRSFVTSPAFDEHVRGTLRSIAERFRAGRLWVALQSRLLNYLWLRETLRYWVARDDSKWIVIIEEIGCDATGRRPLEEADLNGLSFSVPSSAPEVVVAIQGRNATLPVRRAADPGWPGRDAVFMPWKQLEWPK